MSLSILTRKLATVNALPNVTKCIQHNFAKMLSDPENKGERQDHINFDTLGTWDNRIDFPMLLQQSIKHGKPIPKISVKNSGAASVIGRRTTNEDRFKVKELMPNLLYMAVFDGHGGSLCAQYCYDNMEKHIRYWVERDQDLQAALENSFIEINNAFSRYVTYNCRNEEYCSGTTATVCLLRNSIELVVAHVGDSRALLSRNGESRRLTNDHNSDIKTEKERILKSGGSLASDSLGRGLVNGRLAMTRSLGDLDLKRFGVIPLPETRSLEVKHGRDAFLILTSDGINFVMTDQEIINIVNSCSQPLTAAQYVCDQALHYGSEDNSTALIMPFGAWGKFKNHRSNYSQFYSFGRELAKSARF